MSAPELEMLMGMLRSGGINFAAPPAEIRPVFEGIMTSFPWDFSIVTKDRTIGGVPGMWMDSDSSEVILYVHGGGYTIGSTKAYRGISTAIAKAAGTSLFSPEYRLAPEHPYPAALDDATAAYLGLLEAGYSANQIKLVGDSAGGGLAMATLITLRERGVPLPSAVVLLSPWVDMTFSGDSIVSKADADPNLKASEMALAVEAYLAHGQDPAMPEASPLFADLHGLPPVLIETGEAEILLSDSTRLAAKLAESGVDARLHVWPGLPHVWGMFAPILSEGRDVIAEIGEYLGGARAAAPKVEENLDLPDFSELDIDGLRAKALVERDKRVRADGLAQYSRMEHSQEDPFTPFVSREPVTDHVEFTFIGGGFSGLLAGARAKDAGLTSVRLIDSAGDFGGVWYWNRYPGSMCDTASMVYLPLLEETGYMPKEKYAHGPEIFEHARRIARHYDLYTNSLLQTTVESAEWDDEKSLWTVTTNRGDRFTTKYLGMAVGPLAIPKLPAIEGAETYEGTTFHTSRWDFDFTGGSHTEPMDKLKGKRVAVLGTGATSIQMVPELQKAGAEVFVIQRTPTGVDARNNEFLDPEWFESVATPGWQQRWYDSFASCHLPPMTPDFTVEMDDLVQDGWTEMGLEWRKAMATIPKEEFGPPSVIQTLGVANYAHMVGTRARVDEIVKDPAIAEKLKPWYKLFCKRPGFHDEYLQSFNEPNVHLLDTDGQGVERITPRGIVINGVETEVDAIIFASGFEAFTRLDTRFGYKITGRNGLDITTAWANGMRTLHGMFTNGFPNMFIVQPEQGAMFAACITMDSANNCLKLRAVISEAEKRGAREVEVTAEAQEKWMQLLAMNPGGGILFDSECTPGYYNKEGGEPTLEEMLNVTGYPFGSVAFFQADRAWRESGEFEGLDFA
jgi:cyclohexanone monooxygenase